MLSSGPGDNSMNEFLKRSIALVGLAFLIIQLWKKRSPPSDRVPQATEEAKSQNLFATFDVSGSWWLPSDSPDDAVEGKFVYKGSADSNALTLHLNSYVDFRNAIADLMFTEPSDDAALWLHGKSEEKMITLAHAIPENTTSFQNVFFPRTAIIGPSLVTADTKFDEAVISFPGLTEFFTASSKSGTIATFESLGWTVERKGKPLRLDLESPIPFGQQINCLTVRPEDALTMDEFIEIGYAIQYFLSILYGFPTCPSVFALQADGEYFNVLYQFGRQLISETPTASDMALIYSTTSPTEFDAALRKWFTLSEVFLDYTYNFFGNFYHPHPKARVNLVFHSQSLERFHGLTVRGAKPPQDQLDALADVKSFVKTNVAEPLRKGFLETLNFLNKPSQRMRMEALFLDVQNYLPLFDDEDEIPNFINCVVKTRNYHIHGGDKPKSFLTVWEETIAADLLKLANLLLLLKYLGISAEAVHLSHIAAYRVWQSYYRKILNKKAIARKIAGQSHENKYVVVTVEGRPCFFCGTKIIRQTLTRDDNTYRSRTFCPNASTHPESSNKCLACGHFLHRQGSSGWMGETSVSYCSNSGCPGVTA